MFFFDERAGFIGHHLREIFSVLKNLCAVAPEIVAIGALPVKEMRVVVDAAAHVAEGVIETLTVGHYLGRVAQMPFANVRGGVAGGLEGLSKSHFLRSQSRATFGGAGVSGHTGTHGISAGQQAGTRR